MAQAGPASSFVGYDFHADSIAAARKAVPTPAWLIG